MSSKSEQPGVWRDAIANTLDKVAQPTARPDRWIEMGKVDARPWDPYVEVGTSAGNCRVRFYNLGILTSRVDVTMDKHVEEAQDAIRLFFTRTHPVQDEVLF